VALSKKEGEGVNVRHKWHQGENQGRKLSKIKDGKGLGGGKSFRGENVEKTT